MSKIAIHLDHPLIDGEQITFRSPCASTDATGIKIYTPTSYEDDTEISAVYDLKDAGGTTIHGKAGLFASGAYVTVVLNTTNAIAYIHNARSIYQAELDTKLDKNGDAADAKIGSSTASMAFYPIPAANDTFKVILGKIIKFFGDIKGAITSLSISGKTITWTKADGTTGTLTTQDTTYTAGTGLSLSSGKFNHSNAVTAGTAGTSSATSAQNTLAVPYVTYDAQGHVTASGTHTHTINGMGAATASAAGKTGLVPAPAAGKQAQFLRGDATWATPTDTTYTAGTGLTLSGTQFKHSNSVTAGTAGQSSATSGQNTLAVPYVTYDAQGHVTASGTHTHTINGMVAATADAAGNTGLVPKPAAGRNTYYLRGDATWQTPQNNLTTTAAGLVLDARQGKALNDKIGNIRYITPVAGTKDNVANNTVTAIGELTLPEAGYYFVIGNASTDFSGTAGYLAGTVNTQTGLGNAPMSQAFNGTGASIACFWCYHVTASTKVYMVVKQTSGSARSVKYNLTAIQVA